MKPAVISTWLMEVARKKNLVLDAAALRFQTLKIKRFCYVVKRQVLLNSLPHQLRRIPLDSLAVIRSICDDFDFYNVFNGNTFDQHTVFVHKDHEWQVFLASDTPHCNHALPQLHGPDRLFVNSSCSGLASDQKCSA